ncbi:MAG: EAL domain-containing protein, partial [Firmicutes bacterium]|nr:EAL domain-containing protein [Bacillota bacterium]
MTDQPVLTTVFQPVVNLLNGDIVGYEALGRIVGRETEGFSPVAVWARETRRTTTVFRQLQRLALRLGSERPSGTLLFLNVRLADLTQLSTLQVPWDQIVLEVPESDHRLDQWDARLRDLRSLGVQVAIDDWGIGKADPLRLIQLRPHWLKIDLALTRLLGTQDCDRLLELLVRWVNPDTHLIAEGVERPDQIERLRRLGICYGQGFALARPDHTWPTTVAIPAPTKRLTGVARTSLALVHASNISDASLALIERSQEAMAPLFHHAVEHLENWIYETRMANRLAFTERDRYQQVLEHHFHQLTRGVLDHSDIERAQRIARVHQQYGVDLSFYVTGYRQLQAFMARSLREQQQTTLAEALRDLFNWDVSLVLEAYQEILDRDSLTGVLTRQAFWDRVNRDILTALPSNARWVLTVIDLKGLGEINDQHGHLVGDQVLAQVGRVFQEFMNGQYTFGRIGGDVFGLWFPYRSHQAISHDLNSMQVYLTQRQPEISLTLGFAVLGHDGTTAEALYTIADRRLYQDR